MLQNLIISTKLKALCYSGHSCQLDSFRSTKGIVSINVSLGLLLPFLTRWGIMTNTGPCWWLHMCVIDFFHWDFGSPHSLKTIPSLRHHPYTCINWIWAIAFILIQLWLLSFGMNKKDLLIFCDFIFSSPDDLYTTSQNSFTQYPIPLGLFWYRPFLLKMDSTIRGNASSDLELLLEVGKWVL